MRNQALLIMALAAISACAARPARSTAHPVPTRYSCGELELLRDGDKLVATEVQTDGPITPTGLGFMDEAGDHFVSFPTSPTEIVAVEYVIPHDHRADAIERIYDTSRGISRIDWKMTQQRSCKVRGGYTDAFTRWVGGDSYDKVASDLALGDDGDARDLVHEALVRANRRYYHP
jgi:hypothetical protein